MEHTGEICIGGGGVALDYLDLASETRRKFITDGTGAQKRLYRTGDQGRLMADGTLLCLGRLEGDTQIKLRGLRIELQEVESALLHAASGILSSVIVSLRGDLLIAHAVVLPGKDHPSNTELGQLLGRLKLPRSFIPATIVILPTMPTNTNGKLDRKAIASLPLPEIQTGEPKEKMTIHEGELRLLWERVLPETMITGHIASSSDFFLCGGNSLLLMKLQSAIKETTGVAISTRALYQGSTLRGMAQSINELREEQADAAEQEIDWAVEDSCTNVVTRSNPGATVFIKTPEVNQSPWDRGGSPVDRCNELAWRTAFAFPRSVKYCAQSFIVFPCWLMIRNCSARMRRLNVTWGVCSRRRWDSAGPSADA